MMNRNLGRLDIGTRVVIGLALLAFGWHVAFNLNSAYGLLMGLAGMISLMTALAKWCPLYFVIGLNSCPLHNRNKKVF